MKTSLRKKVLWIFSSIFLAICMISIASYTVFTVYADNQANNTATKEKKAKRPTYTETLRENNELLKNIQERLDELSTSKANLSLINAPVKTGDIYVSQTNITQNISYESIYQELDISVVNNTLNINPQKKKNEKLEEFKKNAKNYAKSVTTLIKGIVNSDSLDDTQKFDLAYDFISDAVKGIATCCGPYGWIAEVAFEALDLVKSLATKGAEPLSEVHKLSTHMDEQFNKINAKLDDILESIDGLSYDMDASFERVLSQTQDQLNAMDSKQQVRKFFSRGEGNFSYNEFKNYLYGSIAPSNSNRSKAYYNLVNYAVINGSDDSLVDNYYNQLFNALDKNLPIFEEYIKGSFAGEKSIISHYYDYLSANRENSQLFNSNQTPEYMAIEFASDLMNTYAFAYEVLSSVYSYEALQLCLQAFKECKTEDEFDAYLKNHTFSNLTYEQLLESVENTTNQINSINTYIVKDIAYILGFNESYIAVDPDGTIHDEFCYQTYTTKHINIAKGQTIYTNIMTDVINSMFGLSNQDYSFYLGQVENGEVFEEEIKDKNLFGKIEYDTVSHMSNPYVVLKYQDEVLYKININCEDTAEYNSGDGSAKHPYLIDNEKQFANMVYNTEYDACYKLIDNIDLLYTYPVDSDTNKEIFFNPIGDEKHPFNGTLDGNGYEVSNLFVYSNYYDESKATYASTTGLFANLGQEGVVKNLTIDSCYICSSVDNDGIEPANDDSYFYVGTIAAINNGLITNCKVQNSMPTNSPIVSYDTLQGIYVNRKKTSEDSRNMNLYIGSIAGINYGTIEYCISDNFKINVNSTMYTHAEAESANKNIIYVGGISGATRGEIKNCAVKDSTKVSLKAYSEANASNEKNPYLKVYIGGITGSQEVEKYIKDCYSKMTIEYPDVEVYNEGRHWFLGHVFKYTNVEVLTGEFIPYYTPLMNSNEFDSEGKNVEGRIYGDLYNDALYYYLDLGSPSSNYSKNLEILKTLKPFHNGFISAQESRITAVGKAIKNYLVSERNKAKEELNLTSIETYDDSMFSQNKEEYKVSITRKTTGEIEIGTVFNPEDLEFKVNDKIVDAKVVGYYGYDSINTRDESNSLVVKVFFTAKIDDKEVLLSGDLNVVIEKDVVLFSTVDSTRLSDVYKYTTDEEIYNDLLKGLSISHFFKSGNIITNTITSSNENNIKFEKSYTEGIADHLGKRYIIIKDLNNDVAFLYGIDVLCQHENLILSKEVEATCISLGYKEYTCLDPECNSVFCREFRTGSHKYEVEEGVEATCKYEGYTTSVTCPYCHTVFTEKEFIEKLPHEYVQFSGSKDGYDSTEYHYCKNGDHYEAHQYVVSEEIDEKGDVVYRYTCATCGYAKTETDSNIITKEGSLRPIVYVTDAYYKNVGDVVVVYVELLNNPGFNQVSFGIRYDEGLELLSYEEGSIVPNQLSASNRVHNGYNFLWATGSKNSVEDGYLLKLYFKVNKISDSGLKINVVYGIQEEIETNGAINPIAKGGFTSTDKWSGVQRFLTNSGLVKCVDHLPGDVNDDGVVNTKDAMEIAWHIVGKKTLTDNMLVYADVNLDRDVDGRDVVAILQSISGNYGTNLLDSKYTLVLNLNGYENPDIDTVILVDYYSDNAKLGALLGQSYIDSMQRKGYTFLGWYTRLENGDLVDVTDMNKYIMYDAHQKTQTLYAHWVKNKVVFTNGDVVESSEYNYLKDDAENTVTVPVQTETKNIVYKIDDKSGPMVSPAYGSVTISRPFLGWLGSDGKMYDVDTKIALYSSNFTALDGDGCLYLTPVWGEYHLDLPKEDRDGYANITAWQNKDYFDLNNVDEYINKTSDSTIILNARSNSITYTIVYDAETTNVPDKTYNVAESTNVTIGTWKNNTDYTFIGWTSKDGSVVLKEGDTINSNNFKYFIEIIDGHYYLKLYEKKVANVYKIVIKGINENTSFTSQTQQYGEKVLKTIYYREGAFYSDLACMSEITKINHGTYDNYEVKGYYVGSVKNNGFHDASVNGSYFADSIGRISGAYSVVSDCTVYAVITPNKYTITFTVPSGLYANGNGTTKKEVYYNEVLPNITMPSSEFYYYNYLYNGTTYYNSSGISIKRYTLTSDLALTASIYAQTKSGTYVKNIAEWKKLASSTSVSSNIYLLEDLKFGGALITPIQKFSGTFDGCGHRMENFKLTKSSENMSEKDYCGLIYENLGTIKNLTISSATVTYTLTNGNSFEGNSFSYVGVLTGYNKGTVTNCTFSSCSIEASVTSKHGKNYDKRILDVGAVAGYTSMGISKITVMGCYFTATVTTWYDGQDSLARVGGIVGMAVNTIADCNVQSTTLKSYAYTKMDQNWNRAWDAYAETGAYAGRTASRNFVPTGSNSYSSVTVVATAKTDSNDNSTFSHGGGTVEPYGHECTSEYGD